MESTWESRDLIVLESAVRLVDDAGQRVLITGAAIIEDTGLQPDDVGRALISLDGPYLRLHRISAGGDVRPWYVEGVTPLARHAVGQWPTPENLAGRIVDALMVAADRQADADESSKLKSTALWLGSAGKDLLINVLASVVSRQTGLG